MTATRDYEYELPPTRIAQAPAPERDGARMMALDRASRAIAGHALVRELPRFLAAGDLLVVNDTRVFPARLLGSKAATGGRVELLLVEPATPDDAAPADAHSQNWWALARGLDGAAPGAILRFGDGALRAELIERGPQGRVLVRIHADRPLAEALELHGRPPVPPYIRRPPGDAAALRLDRERYQTVYAARTGAVAAPTAGLHFTDRLLATLDAAGIRRTAITLHVGPGTFRPVKTDDPRQHVMEEERYAIGEDTVRLIEQTRAAGRRVVAVGTTTVRALEGCVAEHGALRPGTGRTRIFIRPPHRFTVIDALLTNFHLPRSTLLMLVSAFAGREFVLEAYREAVRLDYRFYSYGDCMLIL